METMDFRPDQFRHRAQIEAHIDTLISILDEMDGDCDLEDGQDREADYNGSGSGMADDEPSLGLVIGREGEGREVIDDSDHCMCLDLELDDCDTENDGCNEREADSSDEEPALGWTNSVSQIGNMGTTTCTCMEEEFDPAEHGIADEDALDEAREMLAIYQYFHRFGDRDKQVGILDNIAADARNRARRLGQKPTGDPDFQEQPFSLGMALATRVQWGVRV